MTAKGADPTHDAGVIEMSNTRGTTRWTTARWAALVAAGGVTLAGCAGGSDSGSDVAPSMSTTQSSGDGQSESAAGGAAPGSAQDASGRDSSGQSDQQRSSAKASDTTPAGTHVARSAELSLTVGDVDQASAKVRSTARRAGGYVSSEDSRADDGSRGDWAEITVTVPVDELDATITKLADVGEVTHRSAEAEDLTSQYTDTDARVRTMTASVERLRKLIDSADDLDQIVSLESQLSTREADLEALKSQQKSLEKRTTTAPITVSLTTEDAPADEPEEERTGFLAGLGSGWSAFTDALAVGMTVLGAVTPFAVTLAILGAPLVWWVRRRRAARPTATPAAPTAEA